MAETTELGEFVFEGKKNIFPAILHLILVIPVLFIGTLMIGGLIEDPAVRSDFWLFIFMIWLLALYFMFGVYFLIKGIRFLLLKVSFYEKGLVVSGFRTHIITWEQVSKLYLYYFQQRHSGISITFKGLNVHTHDGRKVVINNIFNNFYDMPETLDKHTSERIANELLNELQTSGELKLADTKINSLGMSRKVGFIDESIRFDEIKSVKYEDKNGHYMGMGFFVDKGDYTGFLIPYFNQLNSFALKKIAEDHANQNT